MAGPSSLLSSDLSSGLEAAVRTARKVDLSDSLDAIRTDLGERVEVGRELVGDAAASVGVAVARMQGRSQRRSRRRLAMIGLTNRELLDRAADDGMGAAIGSPTREQASRSASQ